VTATHTFGLAVDVEFDDGRAVVAVAGEIDVYSVTALREELAALDAAGHHLVAVDLTDMTFCDSSGLGVLVGAVKRATAGGGGVSLFGAPEHFLRVLRITGLTKVMPPFERRDEALGWLDAQ
jgi:anti-sigma B factor antagonist